ncbi:glycosyltransferase [Alkalihalobacterium chitinilyticum]|uniref:Glycosyltransferase n=1 Tax=Alkalihalobacterium chitinilyticum TaxID=2980103 RepID=A0ABT5VK32_9BACI|nr:glycosyltransferase [Alkalihalobacterium chitinilyticum]MDE5415810.1 glycosyltransferase [Alkalihalobacterium chitinilyticum]
MGKIKVLFFIYQMGGGGAARTLLNIINNLDRNKFAPMLVTLNMNGSYEKELKEDVKFIKLETTRLSRSIGDLANIIKTEEIDIVFSTIPRVNTIAILANALSRSKAKNVIREADNLGGSFRENLQLLVFGMVYKRSSQIVSLSEGVKENLVKRYKIKPKDIKVIYNPVDVDNINEQINNGTINPDHQEIFNTTDKIIITAGRLVPQKDQRTLLNAFAKVNKQESSRLVILGEGPLKDELLQQAAQLTIEDRIHFVGFQSNPYIYFSKADLFVLTSIHEGFSHVIAEALASGTPVVSTDCKSGPAEVLDGGVYGALCPVGDADDVALNMLRILQLNKEERADIITKGHMRAGHFDAKQIVKQYEAVFLETLKK